MTKWRKYENYISCITYYIGHLKRRIIEHINRTNEKRIKIKKIFIQIFYKHLIFVHLFNKCNNNFILFILFCMEILFFPCIISNTIYDQRHDQKVLKSLQPKPKYAEHFSVHVYCTWINSVCTVNGWLYTLSTYAPLF